MTHWIWTNHRKLLMRMSAANVEVTIVVTMAPVGVENQTPQSMNIVLPVVSPSPVKSGAKPKIATSHPPSACH